MKPGGLFQEMKRLLDTAEPAGLGPDRRASALTVDELDNELRGALSAQLTPAVKDLFRATIYLWHDHLDEAHRIAQEIETQDGSQVHAMMHRREPDYGNAKYWFRRVGGHPAYLCLAVRVSEYLEKEGESDLHSRLVPNKMWDPFAFVDAVEDAEEGQIKSKVDDLRAVQKLEFECFLENLANRV